MPRPLQTAASLLLAAALLAACNGRVYTKDGVTDGDTFYLPEEVLENDDPVLQSWVAYSLALSTCKLAMGGENPAHNSSLRCELEARDILADTWRGYQAADSNLNHPYLDKLVQVDDNESLLEYVWTQLRPPRGWDRPKGMDTRGFLKWMKEFWPDHEPQTRIIGSWNYTAEPGEYEESGL